MRAIFATTICAAALFAASEIKLDEKAFVPVVGNWGVAKDGGKDVVMVDGREWKRGQVSTGLIDKARLLYGAKHDEFVDSIKAFAYFPIAVARNVFGAPDANSPLYQQGVEWAGVCFGAYSAVCFAFAFFLPPMARRNGAKGTHAMCLLAGAAGLASVAVIHTPGLLLLSMTGVGIAWASTLSMPYSMLAGALPPGKTGVYMGIFNFLDRKSTRLNSSHPRLSRMPSSA